MRLPVEVSAVDNCAAKCGSMAAEKFGQRIDDDIRSVLNRPQQDWRCDGVVHDKGDAAAMSDLGKPFNVTNISGRISDALAKDGARLVVDQTGHGIGRVTIGKSHSNTLAGKDVREERVRGSIELRH